MTWPKTNIETDAGAVGAVAPLVVSASRRTDIPAFYAEWFMARLRRGYVKWVNPFNGRPQYVSFERTRAIVFWSKNPKPLLDHIAELNRRELVYYFQFTLNDYASEGLEPCVPPLRERVETFIALANIVGPERVIWRFDPLLLLQDQNVGRLLEKIRVIGEQLAPYTRKLVFSFADIEGYRKVANNLRRKSVPYREFTEDEMREAAAGIASMCQGWGLTACTCAEQLDFSQFGIQHNKCIDDELLLRISGDDPALREFFYGSAAQQGLFDARDGRRARKDPGQRAECGCVLSKDIGQYDTCRHLCLYCYANTSEAAVRRNTANVATDGDCIAGGDVDS